LKIKWSVIIAVLFIIVIFIGLVFLVIYKNEKSISSTANTLDTKYKTVIIDAGHGGGDGGAVAKDGTLEKDINLSISQKLETALKIMGYNVIMTRTKDELIYDADVSKTTRQKKVSDIHNRTDLVNSTPNAVLISIHQNKFPATQYSGTQVFYSPNCEESKPLAQSIQFAVRDLLQPYNKREIKKSGTSIYMLYYVKSPAVMVECGFLSNYEECEKLKSKDYQKQMVFCIMCGILNYL